MSDLRIVVDGVLVTCPSDVSVAAALLNAGVAVFRMSVAGDARAPMCGMGICYECRVTIDDVAQRRACMVTVAEGMRVSTIARE